MALRRRWLMALAGGCLWAIVAAAGTVRPDPRGWRTHEQFGLPPCTFYRLFEMRCPSCGTTTAWAWLVRGRWDEALRASASGTLLAVVALTAGGLLLASAAKGNWVGPRPGDRLLAWTGLVAVALILAEWGARLWLQSTIN